MRLSSNVFADVLAVPETPPPLEPGFLSGLFLSAVFSARFLLEFTKMPQASYDYSLSLNVGQLLSIPPILVGLTLMVLAKRSGRKLLCEQTS
ncbi:prolipoprotein diacylglyceryl transferase family protein [Pseudomonas farris]